MESDKNPKTLHCEKCGRDVVVQEKPGDGGKAHLRHVLVDELGHTLAERIANDDTWRAVNNE
jgi:hypothetical protein